MEGIEKKLNDLRKEIASDVLGLFPHGDSPSDGAIGYLIFGNYIFDSQIIPW